MSETEKLQKLIEQYKAEAESLVAANKLEDAEVKTNEIKILKAKLEIQDKLDEANGKINDLNNQIITKDETIATLNNQLETIKNEKTEAMNKFDEATNTIAELNAKVTEISPIVEQYKKDQYNNKLNTAKDSYRAKFEKCGIIDSFEDEAVQALIVNSIDKDDVVATKAKYELNEKLFNALSINDVTAPKLDDIQESTKPTKNLNPENDEFEAVYGFKKD